MRAEFLRKDAILRCERLVLRCDSRAAMFKSLARHKVNSAWLAKILNGDITSPGTRQLDVLLDALDKAEKK